MTRRPETLDELRVGDEVVVTRGGFGKFAITIERVTRATKAQLMVELPNMAGTRHEWKFWRKDGFEVGGGGVGDYARIGVVDDAALARIDKAKRLAATKFLSEDIAEADLTHDQIARIRAVLEGSEG